MLLLAASTAFAQDTETPKSDMTSRHAVKAYLKGNFNPYVHINTNTGTDLTIKNENYIQPTIAVDLYNKRGNYHEVELSSLFFHNTYIASGTPISFWGGYNYMTTNIAMRYEYVIVYRKSKKLQPAMGFAAMPFYEHTKISPLTSAQFPVITTDAGIKTFFVPRLQFALSPRITIDANVPILLVETRVHFEKRENPTLTPQEREIGVLDLDAMARFNSVRLGASIKL